jgi:hypothetical protein
MARTSTKTWTPNGKLESTSVPVKIDGETVGTYSHVRVGKDKEGKANTFESLDELAKALGFKKTSNAVKAIILGKNKLSAGKARAQAKLDSLD